MCGWRSCASALLRGICVDLRLPHAILAHEGQGRGAKQRFLALPAYEQDALVRY